MSPEDENHYAYAAGYSGEGAFALWYYESTIHWFNVPGLRHTGDYSTATFYVFNFWNGKALKLNTTIKFVSEDQDITPLGEEDIVLQGRDPETGDFYEIEPALSACCEALNCTVHDIVENGVWMTRDADGMLTSANYDFVYGFSYDENGAAIENMDNAVFTCGFSEDNTMRAYVFNDEDLDKEFHTVLYLNYNKKYYAFNITIVKDVTGIKTIESDSTRSGRIYDLSGREVEHPVKGIYIRNGKKFVMK
jgi:hypothetical protein